MNENLHGRDRFLRKLFSGAAPFLLLGCSAVPMGPGIVLAQSEAPTDGPITGPSSGPSSGPASGPAGVPLPGQSSEGSGMDGQLMFELLIAELAGRRGQLDVALAGYLRAAEHTDDPRVSERATRLALFGRQWPEAESACRRWLQLDPDAAQASELLAQSLLRQDKTSEAVAIYQRLLEDSTDPDRTLRQLFAELQSIDDPQQALSVMQSLMQAVPDNVQAHLALARLQLAGNDREAALASVEQALRLDGDDVGGVLLKAQLLNTAGRPEEGFAAVEAVLERHPEKLTLRLGYAQLLVEAGRYDAVGEQLDVLYEKADTNPDTLLTISMLALDARRMERARTYLTSLLQTGEYPDQANFYLARISDQRQDYQAAMDYYEAVGEGEMQMPAQIRIAELLGLSGELDEGRARLQRLAGLTTSPELQVQLLTAESRMLQEAGQGTEAVDALSKGLDRFPGNGELRYARALAADGAGDQDMMMSDLNALIEAEPDNAHALNALGYHLADNNVELDRAEELLVKANLLLPNDPAIMDSLGWLRYRQGRLQEAIELLTSAYKLYPDAEIAAHLGEAMWLNGNEEEARTLIEQALLDSPRDDHLLRFKKKFIE